MFILKRLILATSAALALAAGAAHAIGDIAVRNQSGSSIHPYFKSNWCRIAATSP
jgi:hypothetical protein